MSIEEVFTVVLVAYTVLHNKGSVEKIEASLETV